MELERKIYTDYAFKENEAEKRLDWIKYERGFVTSEIIGFHLKDKKVRFVTNWDNPCVDIPTLKAIIKQCEELGWLE